MGIGKMLQQTLNKLVLRVMGEKANMTCSILKLGAGLESGIVGTEHAVWHWRWERDNMWTRMGEMGGEGERGII